MKRIGLLGGTFNPIHIGHLAMAKMAREKLRLDQVIFVPSNTPPHKTIRDLTSAKDRYRMVCLAVKGYPHFKVSDFEVKRRGRSYSVDTIEFFRKALRPGTKLFFIIGEDALANLHTWRQIGKIRKMVEFIVVNRPGYQSAKRRKGKYHFVSMPDIDVASSFLRNRIFDGKSIKYFVPESVYRYIRRHDLYKVKPT